MIYDYRQTPRAAKGFHVHLGKEHTYFFEWANFETAPKHPANDAPQIPLLVPLPHGHGWGHFAGDHQH